MKNFLKDNWFKLSFAVAILIIAISLAYFLYNNNSRSKPTTQVPTQQSVTQQIDDFDLQKKCSDAAGNFYTKNGFNLKDSSMNGFVSHWNKALNKCFIEYSNGLGNNGIYYTLSDALGGTEYGEIVWTFPNENNPSWCYLYPNGNAGTDTSPTNCKSKIEFDNFVKPFMNN